MSGQSEPAMANHPQILPFPIERERARRFGWSRLLTVVTALYWLAMFTGTHMPHPPRITESGGADKWMHFGAYLGLAMLVSAVLVARRGASGTLAISIIKIVAVLAAVGAFDEISQPLVGRDCEFLDWCADVAGALVGSSAVLGLALMRRRRAVAQRRRAA
jgi:VanZ family protein